MSILAKELTDLSEYVFTARIRPRLEGLTDEEYLWEPVPGCWSLRPDAEGVYRSDLARLLPADRHPFTTLAWRLWHLIGCYGSSRNARLLGAQPSDRAFDALAPAPPTAAEALDVLDAAYLWWAATLRSLTDEVLEEKLGPVAEEYAESTKAAFVIHQLDEAIHHGAETAMMRDLYRAQPTPATSTTDSVIDAAAHGYWQDVRDLVERGGDVNATRPGDFDRTALHYAAAAAPLDVVKLLLDRGANPSVRDTQFNATPLGWAEYFDRADISGYLGRT